MTTSTGKVLEVGLSAVDPPVTARMEGNPSSMMIIGVDPHKSSHTATVVDPGTYIHLGSLRIEATLAGYQRMLIWAKAWPDRQWAIENAQRLGHHLAQWLLARGEVVLDVPATATARVCELSRGAWRKNDRIDAAAATCVTATHVPRLSLNRRRRHLERRRRLVIESCMEV